MKFNFKAFILAIIFCATFITAKNVYSCELNTTLDRGINRAVKLEEADELYAGSSMFRGGLNMNKLAERTDKIFLINYGGLDPAMVSLILEHLINRGLIVKNFYVDMYSWAAARSPWPSDAILFFEAPVELKLKIWNVMKHNEDADLLSAAWEMFIQSGNDMLAFWPIYSRIAARGYFKGGHPASHFNAKTTSS